MAESEEAVISPDELRAIFERVYALCADEKSEWKEEDHDEIKFIYHEALEHIMPLYQDLNTFTRKLFVIRSAVHQEVGMDDDPKA